MLCSCSDNETVKKQEGEIDITWKNEIPGDFSFNERWSYPEGVYKNEFGQLSCDGLCSQQTEKMKGKNGKIIVDSLEAFYKLVDTTHLYHTLNSETNCEEWLGSNYFYLLKIGAGAFDGYSACNAATHCSLKLVIENNACLPLISLNSIMLNGSEIYHCKSGQIEVDSFLFAKGLFKAQFNFNFTDRKDTAKVLFWKGKILTEIK